MGERRLPSRAAISAWPYSTLDAAGAWPYWRQRNTYKILIALYQYHYHPRVNWAD